MLIRHDDGVIYMTTATAAESLGVDKSTISNWRARGLLEVTMRSPNGWPLYGLAALAAAEKRSRDANAKRRRFLDQLRNERLAGSSWPSPINRE